MQFHVNAFVHGVRSCALQQGCEAESLSAASALCSPQERKKRQGEIRRSMHHV